MEKNIESLAYDLEIKPEEIETKMPGAFVKYVPIKDRSSDIKLASLSGVIQKSKERKLEKAIYEFISLDIWNNLLNEYSEINDLKFRAPKPIAIRDIDSDSPSLLMEFLNGYELRKVGNLKRTTPVRVGGQKYPLPLYPAIALHLGALNRIKEMEGLYHGDYDDRHIIFNLLDNVSVGAVDLENSRGGMPDTVKNESAKMKDIFKSKTCSQKDLDVLDSWYMQGYETVTFGSGSKIGKVLEKLQEKYGIDIDFMNGKIGGRRLRLS